MATQVPTESIETERWRRAEELYHAALQRRPHERDTFLEEACAGDRSLLGEVKSLLGYEPRARQFIENPGGGDRDGRLAGGPLSMDDALDALRQIVRDWRERGTERSSR